MPQCLKETKSGKQCSRQAHPDGMYCTQHGDAAQRAVEAELVKSVQAEIDARKPEHHAEPASADSDAQRGILRVLQKRGSGLFNGPKHVYAGTVDPVTVAERRKKNKAARKARRATRKNG